MVVKNNRSAQTFLALVFLIGGIITVAGITLAFLASSFIDTGYGLRSSLGAEAVASAGAQDAILKLERNLNYSNTGGYSLAVGSSTATVKVTQLSPSAGFVTVLSTATVSAHTKNVNVVLSENSTTDQLAVVSWTEI